MFYLFLAIGFVLFVLLLVFLVRTHSFHSCDTLLGQSTLLVIRPCEAENLSPVPTATSDISC